MKKDDNNERIDEVKEAECPDGTPPDDMEEGLSERNNNKNKKYDEGKNEGETTNSESTTIYGGKFVNNEEFGNNVNLDEFYDIYDNDDKNITEDSIVWLNTNKTIWEGRVIKIPFSEVPEDAKHLKLIWINTKKEDRVLIKNYSK